MDQALPLLSGESLGTMLKTAPKITKFIDEFFCVEWSVLWVYISLTGIELSEHVLVSEEKRQAVQNVVSANTRPH